MPFGGKLSDPTGERGTELSDNKMLLNLALIKAEIEKNKIERYISQIDNSEMRTIIRLRCIEFRTWEQIEQNCICTELQQSEKFLIILKCTQCTLSMCYYVRVEKVKNFDAFSFCD